MTSSIWLRPEVRHALLGTGGLHAQAAAALQRRALDADALRQLGDIERGNGRFTAAHQTYRRLCALRPGDPCASWLCAITGNHRLPAPPTGVRAAPFVQIPNFLTSAEGERLLSWAQNARGRFAPAKVGPSGKRRVDISERRGLAAPPKACKDIGAWLVPKVRAVLPTVSARLRLQGFDSCRIVPAAAAYLNGGYGRPHRDSPPLVGNCYFHAQPRRFSGGDLLLYDTEVETGDFDACAFSRVEPAANSVVFHPGAYVHEVTRVVCGTDRFTDARFAMTCTIWPNDGAGT